MAEYQTKHKIGDLVYTANVNDVDRDVIKAVKIVGLKEEVQYGFKVKTGSASYFNLWFSGTDDYSWYTAAEIFEDKESAAARHENLKTKHEAERAKEKAKEKAERKKDLLAEIAELENE